MKKFKQLVVQFLKKIGFNIIQVRGFARLQVINPDGSIASDTGFQENVITYTGLAALAGLAGNTGGVTAFTYLAVGTSSTAATQSQTALVAELSTLGLSRTSATASRTTTSQTNDTLTLTNTWSVTGSTTVNEIGVFNASSSGVMAARKVTTATALINGQQLLGTYNIQFA